MTKSQARKIKELLPILKAVRERCLDCSAYNPYEVKMCPVIKCSLYPYRFGNLKRIEENPIVNSSNQAKNKDSVCTSSI